MNFLFTKVDNNGITTTYYEASDYITLFAFVLFIGFLIFIAVKITINSIKAKKKALSELEVPVEDTPITEIDARIIKKECFVKTYGIKNPESRKEFYITFLSFQGETLQFSVSEELYLAVEENMTGTIALIGDNFFDFYFEKIKL